MTNENHESHETDETGGDAPSPCEGCEGAKKGRRGFLFAAGTTLLTVGGGLVQRCTAIGIPTKEKKASQLHGCP